jgi:hypothetical protein
MVGGSWPSPIYLAYHENKRSIGIAFDELQTIDN